MIFETNETIIIKVQNGSFNNIALTPLQGKNIAIIVYMLALHSSAKVFACHHSM